jgi:hypothetical protein
VDPAPPTGNEPPKPRPARTLTGTIRSVEAGPKIVVEGPDAAPVTVLIDRNTAIYMHRDLGTVRDLRVGEPVRVSVSDPDNRALWLELERGVSTAQDATTAPSVPPGEMAPAAGGSGPPGSAPVPPGPAMPTAPGAPGR